MDQEQATRLIARGLFLETLISSLESALLTVGVSPSEVENFKSQLTGAPPSGEPAEAAAPSKKEKKTDTVLLANGNQVEAEVKSERTKGGRTRNYIRIGRKRILLSRKKGRWQERAKAKRDFSNYVLTSTDKELLQRLGELVSKTGKPGFMDLANALGKTRGQLLGHYRNVYGAGYVEKVNGKVLLTDKGRQYVASLGGAAKASAKTARRGSAKTRKK
jgi:hypothetical protein